MLRDSRYRLSSGSGDRRYAGIGGCRSHGTGTEYPAGGFGGFVGHAGYCGGGCSQRRECGSVDPETVMKCHVCQRRVRNSFNDKLQHVLKYHPDRLIAGLPLVASVARAMGETLGERMKGFIYGKTVAR